MRRVFAVIGFSFLFTSLFTLNFGVKCSLICAFVSALLLIISLVIKPVRRIKALALIFACITLASLNTARFIHFDYDKASAYSGVSADTVATALDYPEYSDTGYIYTFRCVSINGEKTKPFKFYMYTGESFNITPYDNISANIEFSDKYCSKNHDYANGVYLSCYVRSADDVKIIHNQNRPIMYRFVQLKQYFKSSLDNKMNPGESGLAKGLLFSDKSGMSDDTVNSFRKCGLSHTVAVSGMHISIIINALFFLLLGLGVNKRKSSVIGIIFTIAYLMLIGFRYSALRAGIMMIIILLGNLVSRSSDAVNSLGAASFIFVLINPYSSMDMAFLLSLCSTLGMVILFPPLDKKLASMTPAKNMNLFKAAKAFVTPFIQSVCANLFILPLSYMFFGRLSVISPIVNMLAMPFISFDIILCLLTALLSFVPYVGTALGFLASLVAKIAMNIINWFASFKITDIGIGSRSIGLWIASVFVILALTQLFLSLGRVDKRSRAFRCAAEVCVAMLAVITLSDNLIMKDTVSVDVLDSGNGVCMVINSENHAYVIGTGGKCEYSLKRYLSRNGIETADTVIIPSSDKQYAGSAVNVLKSVYPEKVIMNKKDDIFYAVQPVAPLAKIYEYENSITHIGDDITITSLENAVYVKIGMTGILLADRKTDFALLDDYAKCPSVLVICGSVPKNIEQCRAKYAVLCNDNSKYAYSAVKQAMTVYSTADNGNIEIITRKHADIKIRGGI